MNPTKQHLLPTSIIDSDHESVQEYAHQHVGSSRKPIDQAVSLYYAVLDGIRYNPLDYIRFRGECDDVPLEEIQNSLKNLYSSISFVTEDADFDDDVNKEMAAFSKLAKPPS